LAENPGENAVNVLLLLWWNIKEEMLINFLLFKILLISSF